MSEAIKENPKTPKRSKRKPAMEPLGWDEIVSQPGMGGYLSFLNGPVPLPHLQTPGSDKAPGVDSGPAVENQADGVSRLGIETPSPASAAPAKPAPGVGSDSTPLSYPAVELNAVVESNPDAGRLPAVVTAPAAESVTAAPIPERTPGPATLSTPGVTRDPDRETDPGSTLVPATITISGSISTLEVAPVTEVVQAPASEKIPEVESHPAIEHRQGSKQRQGMEQSLHSDPQQVSMQVAGSHQPAGPIAAPGVISPPVFSPVPGFERANRIRIRRCLSAQDGHSLGEEVLYQALWKTARPEKSSTSRTITVGWRGMSQLCRMTPKNCKINTQRLLRKLALDVLSPYNTPESVGTTYRIYSSDEILERRRTAGFEWVIRSRGVEFVDPATGTSLSAQLCTNVSG